ncbi:sodium channel subunit beta-2 [Grus japonensis]|uniref:Sodium channel subunit beta-2 n=5 Tax=Neoaves TaxID=3078114 RepID=A0ABC9XR02_GRUJA
MRCGEAAAGGGGFFLLPRGVLLLLGVCNALSLEIKASPKVRAFVGEQVLLKCSFKSSSPITDSLTVDWTYRPLTGGQMETIFHYQSVPYPTMGKFKDRISWVGNVAKGDASIAIQSPVMSDNGTFICSVKNPPDVYHNIPQTVLIVTERERCSGSTGWVFTEPQLRASTGHSVLLQCLFRDSVAKGCTMAKVDWLRMEGNDTQKEEMVFYYYSNRSTPVGRFKDRVQWQGNIFSCDGSIQLQNVQVNYSGTYVCEIRLLRHSHIFKNHTVLHVSPMVQKGPLHTQKSFKMSLEAWLPQPTLFLTGLSLLLSLAPTGLGMEVMAPATINALNGSSVKLSCTFNSCYKVENKQFSLNWTYQECRNCSEELFLQFRMKIMNKQLDRFGNRVEFTGNPTKYDVSFTLKNVQLEDEGTYNCYVLNPPDRHRGHASISLKVLTKEPPKHDSTVAVIVGASVGGFLAVVILVLMVVKCVRRKKQQRLNTDDQKTEEEGKTDGEGNPDEGTK